MVIFECYFFVNIANNNKAIRAHMGLPAISEGTRAILSEQPITNIEEVVPGSNDQGDKIVKNFKGRRKIESGAPLICGIPFHGTFAAGANINDAFLYTEVANNCAKILIYRQTMFEGILRQIFQSIKDLQKKILLQ